MVRLGLIGAGAWGKNYIAAVRDSGNAELAWVAGRDWAQQLSVDGIIIATPPEPRATIIHACTGMPMMVEKPLCLSMSDALSIRASVNQTMSFLVNYQHLFSPKYETIRTQCRGFLPRVSGKARGPEVRSYSQLCDYGPHFLAMAAGLGANLEDVKLDLAIADDKVFDLKVEVEVYRATQRFFYDGRTERPLVNAVRAFAKAVQDGGTDDWRFGVDMSVAITKELERRSAGVEVSITNPQEWLTRCNVCGKPGTNYFYMGGNVYCCDEHGAKDNPRLKRA